MYTQIRKNLRSNYIKDVNAQSNFVNELPLNLKQKLSIHIYKSVYTTVEFLKKHQDNHNFLIWLCPLLKARLASSQHLQHQLISRAKSPYSLVMKLWLS